MSALNRRQFMTRLAGSGLTVGLLPHWATAQATNDQVLFFIFLRGAADGVSILHPAAGSSPARRKYEAWHKPTTRIARGRALTGGLAMHPAFAPLQDAIDARHFAFVPGVGGAQFNRSHFQQQDLVESGSSTASPLVDGVLGRAWTELRGDTPGLGALSLTSLVPYSLRRSGAPPAVAVPSLGSFGTLSSNTHRADEDSLLRERLRRLYVPTDSCRAGNKVCEAGQQAVANIDQLGELVADATVTGRLGADLASLIEADTTGRLKLLTLDMGGWDTHNGQGNDSTMGLADRLAGLAGLLKSLYDESVRRRVFRRLTVLVMTEFGRTTLENGTSGTDHGYGGVSMVMSTGVVGPVVPTGWFPAGGSGDFYDKAEDLNVMPRLIEHRQVFAEVLGHKLGVSDLSRVLPGFTPGASRIFR